VSPFVQWRWYATWHRLSCTPADLAARSIGAKYGPDDYTGGMNRMRVSEQWLLKHVLDVGASRTLLVTQSENAGPNYRDAPAP
jgi:hypothetical protein